MNLESLEIKEVIGKLESLDMEGLILLIALREKGLAVAASLSIDLYNTYVNRKADRALLDKLNKINVFPILAQTSKVGIVHGYESLIEQLLYKLAEKYALDSDNIFDAFQMFPLSDEILASIQGYADRYIPNPTLPDKPTDEPDVEQFEEPPDDPDYDFNLP